MASFKNDYSFLAHPRYMDALARINEVEQTPYGLDAHSKVASGLIRNAFSCPGADVHFLAGGTQVNLVFLSGVLKPFQGVIACSSGHINVHESAAIEGSGHKIFTLPGKDGKLSGRDIEEALALNGDEHTVNLGAVYISNSTETGTIYSKQELFDLRKTCDRFGLLLFLDGARLGSALTCEENDVEPRDIAKACDGFTIGGTKNGMLLGEALVLVNPSLHKGFRNHIKNKGAMLAKGYLVGAEFEEAFRDGFYFDLAKQTNDMAAILRAGLTKLGLDVAPSPSNQIFVTLSNDKALKVVEKLGCEKWEDKGDTMAIRFVTSFKTNEKDVEEALEFMRNL